MISSCSSIKLCPSSKPFYSEHNDLIRLRIELLNLSDDYFKQNSPSLSSLFFDQLSSHKYLINNNELSEIVISFGYIYLLKYQNEILIDKPYPKTLDSLLNNHFLPPLCNTFFPSTILERIEITEENFDYFQQIFYKSNHTIKREVLNFISHKYFFLFLFYFSILNII
jgi:hypothetical protein